jgi:hypothetical protein
VLDETEVTDTLRMPRHLLRTIKPRGDDEGREGGVMKRCEIGFELRRARAQDRDGFGERHEDTAGTVYWKSCRDEVQARINLRK